VAYLVCWVLVNNHVNDLWQEGFNESVALVSELSWEKCAYLFEHSFDLLFVLLVSNCTFNVSYYQLAESACLSLELECWLWGYLSLGAESDHLADLLWWVVVEDVLYELWFVSLYECRALVLEASWKEVAYLFECFFDLVLGAVVLYVVFNNSYNVSAHWACVLKWCWGYWSDLFYLLGGWANVDQFADLLWWELCNEVLYDDWFVSLNESVALVLEASWEESACLTESFFDLCFGSFVLNVVFYDSYYVSAHWASTVGSFLWSSNYLCECIDLSVSAEMDIVADLFRITVSEYVFDDLWAVENYDGFAKGFNGSIRDLLAYLQEFLGCIFFVVVYEFFSLLDEHLHIAQVVLDWNSLLRVRYKWVACFAESFLRKEVLSHTFTNWQILSADTPVSR